MGDWAARGPGPAHVLGAAAAQTHRRRFEVGHAALAAARLNGGAQLLLQGLGVRAIVVQSVGRGADLRARACGPCRPGVWACVYTSTQHDVPGQCRDAQAAGPRLAGAGALGGRACARMREPGSLSPPEPCRPVQLRRADAPRAACIDGAGRCSRQQGDSLRDRLQAPRLQAPRQHPRAPMPCTPLLLPACWRWGAAQARLGVCRPFGRRWCCGPALLRCWVVLWAAGEGQRGGTDSALEPESART